MGEGIFNVIIAGSRVYNDYETLREKCDYYLSGKIQSGVKVRIISGHAKGADSLGERYAQERGLECSIYPADWEKYGKSAGYRRNAQMAEVADACIAFFSSYSENKGTKMMVELAKSKGIPTREVYEDEE